MNLYYLIFSALCFAACSSYEPAVHKNHNEQALQYLNEVLDSNGGFDQWKNLEEMQFTKATRMFLPDSSIEFAVLQRHTYKNFPRYHGKIEYLNDPLNRVIEQIENDVRYYENGEEVLDSTKIVSAAKNIKTQYYVIGLPFKLKDYGPLIKGIDETILRDGRKMDELHVIQYDENDQLKDEEWWLYFDQDSKRMKAYLISHENRYSYILNGTDTIVNGFHFPITRQSIAMDNNKDNAYLRADYIYSDISFSVKEN